MASRNEVLEAAKTLVNSARDLSAAPANPFDVVSGTPALDSLKLNGQVISDDDLKKLLADIDKAKSDDETWKKIAGTIGGFLGGLAKSVLIPAFLLLVLSGCASTPPPILDASRIEKQAMVAFKQDHDAIIAAYHADLVLALETQIRLIEDYEIRLRGANVPEQELKTLMQQARAKREEIAQKMESHRQKIKTADGNFEIALRIHDAIDGFLSRPRFEMSDVVGLVGQVVGLKEQQK